MDQYIGNSKIFGTISEAYWNVFATVLFSGKISPKILYPCHHGILMETRYCYNYNHGNYVSDIFNPRKAVESIKKMKDNMSFIWQFLEATANETKNVCETEYIYEIIVESAPEILMSGFGLSGFFKKASDKIVTKYMKKTNPDDFPRNFDMCIKHKRMKCMSQVYEKQYSNKIRKMEYRGNIGNLLDALELLGVCPERRPAKTVTERPR